MRRHDNSAPILLRGRSRLGRKTSVIASESSVVLESGPPREFVPSLAPLGCAELGTRAKFQQLDLARDEAAEIDALIPPGTVWLGG